MTFKLNIIDPWDYGTESAIDVTLIKKVAREFLLFLRTPIMFKNKKVQYFVCVLKRKEDEDKFNNGLKGTYPINMVFDENINCKDSGLQDFENYRGNFLYGEIII